MVGSSFLFLRMVAGGLFDFGMAVERQERIVAELSQRVDLKHGAVIGEECLGQRCDDRRQLQHQSARDSRLANQLTGLVGLKAVAGGKVPFEHLTASSSMSTPPTAEKISNGSLATVSYVQARKNSLRISAFF